MSVLKRIWDWSQDDTRKLWFEYGGLALIILLPLLPMGYVLTLDLVFTPHFKLPGEVTNAYPLQIALWVLYHVLPGDVIEKMLLFSILTCSGVGMHLLFRSATEQIRADVWSVAAYFSGIFYMINPFTYSRFMAGQWMVLLGYALLPFFVRALLGLLLRPSWRQSMVVGLWAFLITTVSLHHVGMLIILGFTVLTVGCIRRVWFKKEKTVFLKGVLLAGVMWTVLSSFWLIPTITGDTSISRAVSGFDAAHFNAFATSGSNILGALGNVLRLQGFWAESQQLFLLPQQVIPAWGLIFVLVWVLLGMGMVWTWRKNRVVFCIGMVSIVFGVVMATTPIVAWLGSLLPVMNGYREPHKFVNLVVLGYALFGGYGVMYLRQKWQTYDRARALIACGILALPIVITPVFLGGFSGQLKPREYPAGWQQTNHYVRQRIGDSRALFLPWHQYARYSFSGRTIANPAAKYFEFPTIISNDPEFKNVPPTLQNKEASDIQTLLRNSPEQLASYLKKHNVRFVLLAKEQEYQHYRFLNTSEYIALLKTDTLTVYGVKDEE